MLELPTKRSALSGEEFLASQLANASISCSNRVGSGVSACAISFEPIALNKSITTSRIADRRAGRDEFENIECVIRIRFLFK
jgi:hypothetical protein